MLAYSLIVNMYQYVTLSGAKHTFFCMFGYRNLQYGRIDNF